MQLRLDEEVHAIQEKIRLSDYRDSIKFESRWAVRPSNILQAINETNPTVIHFSGHGTEEGDLVLQNPDGSTKLVTKEAMSATISTLSSTIRLVVFNACFSKPQAVSVIRHIESAIGMTDSIGDEAAQIFAAQLYSSIGFGHSLENSFRQAKAALMLENIPEDNTPQLFVREDIDGNNIILVQPQGDSYR
ncbi:MAG: CHAT domain-containing protein [Treponema sp.]|nr:CHAT domain-containing protein [Treponema sp.]